MDKFSGNFRLLGRVDSSPILEKTQLLTEADWVANVWRQKRFDTHADTQTIELIFDTDFRHEDPTPREKYFELGFDTLLEPLVETINDFYTGDGYVVRAILVRLKGRGTIPTHVDTGYTLMNCRRIHMPVVSTDQVEFTIGGEQQVMKAGELWEINNAREHSVVNKGDDGRVHLIIDWVPQ
jgi:Aspartyl/Asparaginyl beta-hydroxylase